MTETELRAAGMDFRKVYTHQNGHAAYYPGTAPLFLVGGMMTYHGYHMTPLAVGNGGMPMVAHAEDQLAQRPGALEHI